MIDADGARARRPVLREAAIGVAIVVAVLLAIVQIFGTLAVRGSAVVPAWVTLVPDAVAQRLLGAAPRVAETFATRLAVARSAIARGDAALAERFAEGLPAGADRDALDGEIALARGDRAAAIAAFVRADDLDDLTARANALANGGDALGAIAIETGLFSRLQARHAQRDTQAAATFALGRFDQARAYQLPLTDPQHRAFELRALEAYRVATVLSPLDSRYLIAYANEMLDLDDLAGARAVFEHTRAVAPFDPDAWTGLGDAALRAGDRAEAQADLARARALDPNSASAARLAARLAR